MQHNKKGLSDLVSNVLIILLVFASIAIMGVIILNLVKMSGDSIENAAACKQINVKPVQCIHNVSDANFLFSTEYETGVVLKEVDTVAVFSDGTTADQSILGAVLGNFETQSVRESRGNPLINKNYSEFYTITKFTDKKGTDRTCVSDKVDCTLYSPSGSSSSDGNNANGERTSSGQIILGDATKKGSGGSNGGSNGGNNNTVVNGVCGTTLNACTTGALNDILDNSSDYLWQCTGANSGSTASCNLTIPANTTPFALLTPGDIGYNFDYVPCTSICYNHSYPSAGQSHDIRIYSYKIVNGVKYFSQNYTSYLDLYGHEVIEEVDDINQNYNIQWYWDSVAGADGYRILKADTSAYRIYDHYYDTNNTSFYDGWYPMVWTYGKTVTPTYGSYNYSLSIFASPTLVIDGSTSYGAIRIISPITESHRPVILNSGELPAGISITNPNIQYCTPSFQNGNSMMCTLSFTFRANSSAVSGTSQIEFTATTADTPNKIINMPIFTSLH